VGKWSFDHYKGWEAEKRYKGSFFLRNYNIYGLEKCKKIVLTGFEQFIEAILLRRKERKTTKFVYFCLGNSPK
jgi:hypothetical protein